MGLLEIKIPSGMEADTDSIDTSGAGDQFTSIEKAFRQVNLFFDAVSCLIKFQFVTKCIGKCNVIQCKFNLNENSHIMIKYL